MRAFSSTGEKTGGDRNGAKASRPLPGYVAGCLSRLRAESVEETPFAMRRLVVEDRSLLLGACIEETESAANGRADPLGIGLEPARDQAADVFPSEPAWLDLGEELVGSISAACAPVGPRFQHREPSHECLVERPAGPEV